MLQIFRLGIVLKCQTAVTMTHQQAGLVYALLAEANGRALRIEPVLPPEEHFQEEAKRLEGAERGCRR